MLKNLTNLKQDEVVKISPCLLSGTVLVPSSKSIGHREIICAGLADGDCIVDNISMSKDIEATIRVLLSLGIKIVAMESSIKGRIALKIKGKKDFNIVNNIIDCGESGSTLRFFIPLLATLDKQVTLLGHGKLISRPLNVYYDIFNEQKISYINANGILPLTIEGGNLQPGHFKIPGNISSQFISGLLFALPLLKGDSVIEITSPLESSGYVDMTIASLADYGICITNEGNKHKKYIIKGNQVYKAKDNLVEGDWSQAAFWAVGGCLGKNIICKGVDFSSLQGDKEIIKIMESMGVWFKLEKNSINVKYTKTRSTIIDASSCPDLIPILTVLASVSNGTTKIINAGRLRIKECDRLAAIASELNKMGAHISEESDGLIIYGNNQGLKGGCVVDAWNDHRIAMSLAIAVQCCAEPIILKGAGSVNKSYPEFWQDYQSLGGKIEVLV